MAPAFGQQTFKSIVADVESNAGAFTALDLTRSASFCMRSLENTVALSRALAKNTIIKTVILRGCAIVDEGAAAIAAALEQNSTIRELDLGENSITTSGVIALAGGLEKNTGLRTLNLGDQTQCKVLGNDAVESFIAAFEHNTTLVKLIWKVSSLRSDEISKLLARNIYFQKTRQHAQVANTAAGSVMGKVEERASTKSPDSAPFAVEPELKEVCVGLGINSSAKAGYEGEDSEQVASGEVGSEVTLSAALSSAVAVAGA